MTKAIQKTYIPSYPKKGIYFMCFVDLLSGSYGLISLALNVSLIIFEAFE